VKAHPIDADPTGAGDAFAAGYLASRSAGLAPVAAARRATSLVGTLLTGRRR
jgi:sugar/nucleoside kinase (ribokinase family)